jgi:cytosine/adenosine deaminase-related metal-dependent hydrolase
MPNPSKRISARPLTYGGHPGYITTHMHLTQTHSEQAKKHLRDLIEEGLSSGPGRALTPKRVAQLRKRALGDMR